jgi:small conductance mechanosensitive channel
MDINLQHLSQTVAALLVTVILKVLGAVIVYMIGRWLISIAISIMQKALDAQHIDVTIQRYLGNIISVTLNIALVIAILGYFGVETTTFAALLAGVGIAIGAAWSGLLANFAAGAFLVILRPYKVGDFVQAAGVTGTVREIGLFVTTIDTPDNVQSFVGNGKVFSDTIQNFSANPYRRVDLVAQLDNSVDANDAIRRLTETVAKIPNVLQAPAPDIVILEFNLAGPVLAVRPYTHTDHYWQVFFDVNKLIKDTFGAAGYPVPETHYALRQTA